MQLCDYREELSDADLRDVAAARSAITTAQIAMMDIAKRHRAPNGDVRSSAVGVAACDVYKALNRLWWLLTLKQLIVSPADRCTHRRTHLTDDGRTR